MNKKPTDVLEEEHRVIQRVVGIAAAVAEQLEANQPVEAETLSGVVEFMRTFADRCHHGKEESHLFPLLEAKGVPVRGCPMGVLVAEHQRGRTIVAALATATETYVKGNLSARTHLLENLRGIRDLYPNHIWKEDYLLFPMTNKILTAKEQEELQEKFEAVEKEVGLDTHHQFEVMVENLEKKTQIP